MFIQSKNINTNKQISDQTLTAQRSGASKGLLYHITQAASEKSLRVLQYTVLEVKKLICSTIFGDSHCGTSESIKVENVGLCKCKGKCKEHTKCQNSMQKK